MLAAHSSPIKSMDRASVYQFCDEELTRRIDRDRDHAGYWECKRKVCRHFTRLVAAQEYSQPRSLTDEEKAWVIAHHHFLAYPAPPPVSRISLPSEKRDLIARAARRSPGEVAPQSGTAGAPSWRKERKWRIFRGFDVPSDQLSAPHRRRTGCGY